MCYIALTQQALHLDNLSHNMESDIGLCSSSVFTRLRLNSMEWLKRATESWKEWREGVRHARVEGSEEAEGVRE